MHYFSLDALVWVITFCLLYSQSTYKLASWMLLFIEKVWKKKTWPIIEPFKLKVHYALVVINSFLCEFFFIFSSCFSLTSLIVSSFDLIIWYQFTKHEFSKSPYSVHLSLRSLYLMPSTQWFAPEVSDILPKALILTLLIMCTGASITCTWLV